MKYKKIIDESKLPKSDYEELLSKQFDDYEQFLDKGFITVLYEYIKEGKDTDLLLSAMKYPENDKFFDDILREDYYIDKYKKSLVETILKYNNIDPILKENIEFEIPKHVSDIYKNIKKFEVNVLTSYKGSLNNE